MRLIGKVTVTTDQIKNVAGSRLRVEPEPESFSCESHFEPKRLCSCSPQDTINPVLWVRIWVGPGECDLGVGVGV